mgnify:CR=1 FL=1
MRKLKQLLGFYKSYTVLYNNRAVHLTESHRCHKLEAREFTGSHIISNLIWSEVCPDWAKSKSLEYLIAHHESEYRNWNKLWQESSEKKDLWQETGIDDICIKHKDIVKIYDGLKFYLAFKQINN